MYDWWTRGKDLPHLPNGLLLSAPPPPQPLTRRLAERVDDPHWLHLERPLAVLGEHAADGVEHHFGLGEVRRGALDEDVAGVQGDLGGKGGHKEGGREIRVEADLGEEKGARFQGPLPFCLVCLRWGERTNWLLTAECAPLMMGGNDRTVRLAS